MDMPASSPEQASGTPFVLYALIGVMAAGLLFAIAYAIFI